jgi:coatomer subunit beta'
VTHSPNGHLFGIYSDQEFSIYRSQTFKNAGFGQGTDLVWSNAGDYAVRETFTIKFYKGASNQLQFEVKTDFIVEQLFGGPLLGAKGAEFIVFYHWETAKVIRKIDVCSKKVIWNEVTNTVALATADEIYFLQYRIDLLEELLLRDEEVEGYEEAFDVGSDIIEAITSGAWVASVFINYCI